MRVVRGGRSAGQDDLVRWLADGYAPAYRTALLLLRNQADAEEAVQDAFLRAWRFRAAVPAGEGVKPWLYRVVVNASLSKLRADGTRRARTIHLADHPTAGLTRNAFDDPGNPEQGAVAREQRQALLDAVGELPEHLRVVVVLRYYAQLTEKEIADVIHRRPGTVKSRLHTARAQLAADERLASLAEGSSLGGQSFGDQSLGDQEWG